MSFSWRKALWVGLTFLALMCLIFLVVLIGGVVPPLLVFLIVFAALAVLVQRVARSWPVWVALVATVLFIGGNLPFIVEDFAHPETGFSFVPTVLSVLGGLFVIIASIMTLRRADGGARNVGLAFIVLGVVSTVASVVITMGVEDDAREPGDVLIAARDVEYPDEATVAAGDAVYVENRDPFRHTFTIEGTEINEELPGSTARRVVIELEPGTYRMHCEVPGHESMEGDLIVK